PRRRFPRRSDRRLRWSSAWRFPARLVGGGVQQNRLANANATAPGTKQEPRTKVRGSAHFSLRQKRPSSVYARRNRADHVVIRTRLARIGAARTGRAVRIGADVGGGRGRACGRVLQTLIRSLMMLRGQSRRGEQGNAQRGQDQIGAEGFHF